MEAAQAHGAVLVLVEGLQQKLPRRHPLLRIRPRKPAYNPPRSSVPKTLHVRVPNIHAVEPPSHDCQNVHTLAALSSSPSADSRLVLS